MTTLPVDEEDVAAVLALLRASEQRHGPLRTMALAAAQVRAGAGYLAGWLGPSVTAEILLEEANRVVEAAAAGIAVPNAGERPSPRPLSHHLARAAAWSAGLFAAFLLGFGVSGLALG